LGSLVHRLDSLLSTLFESCGGQFGRGQFHHSSLSIDVCGERVVCVVRDGASHQQRALLSDRPEAIVVVDHNKEECSETKVCLISVLENSATARAIVKVEVET
jgi:hypothetical protein